MINVQIYGAVVLIVAFTLFLAAVRTDDLSTKTESVLNKLEDHKEDIIVSIIGFLIVGRCLLLSDSDWVELIASGEMFYIIMGIGIALGAGKSGDGVRKWLKNKTKEKIKDSS